MARSLAKVKKKGTQYTVLYAVRASVYRAFRGWATFYFPIWWYVAPTIINTFLESYDFSGKKIVLFATSGGSGFGKAVESLKKSVSDTTEIVEGKVLNGRLTTEDLKDWVSKF